MKVLIETDQKYIGDIIQTIVTELDCNRFALNRDGYDIVFDMRDRYNGKGQKLLENQKIALIDGKLVLVEEKNEKTIHNS